MCVGSCATDAVGHTVREHAIGQGAEGTGTRKPALKTLVIQTTLALFTTDNDQYYN